MTQLSALLDRVHDEYPAVPEALALRALSDSAKEFCSRTHAWQDEVPRVTLRAGTATYTLYPDDGTQIVAMKDVRLDGKRLNPVATERLRLQSNTPSDALPTEFIQLTPTTFELTTAPLDTGRLSVKAALTLALGSTEYDMPDALLDEYGEAIASGAKMRLVRQAGMPWSAPDQAMSYGIPYYAAINAAKLRTMTALGEADMQLEMRNWA